MRLFVFALLLCLLTVPAFAAEPPRADFYVSPDGNDLWSGTQSAPNAAKDDGPFATFDQARRAVRDLKNRGEHAGPIVVRARAGTYFLRQPLLLTSEDTGTQTTPIIYEAMPGERVVLSGGVPITGWQQAKPGVWTTTLPDVQRGAWNFSQLWANDTRMMRPRLPKNGYYLIDDALPPSARAQGKGFDRFKFAPGNIQANWSNLHDVEALCFQTWTMARLRVENVDAARSTVAFTGNTRSLESYAALPKGNRYILENVKEALSEPGEWYLDRPTGGLTYLPRPGETPANTAIIAPQLEQLVQLTGDKTTFLQYVTFRGFTFAHTNWNEPLEGNAFAQAEVNINAAITLTNARNCAIENCRIAHIGNYAVEIVGGCKYNRIENCVLSDLGAGGVKLGEQRIEEDINFLTSNNVVRNCLIAHGGRLHPAAVGIWIGHSPFNQIEHNAIVDFYYTGISAGWSWGYGRSECHDNHIADNRIARIGQGVLSDMGGIYTLGLSPGTVLEGNVISDVNSFGYGGWGIYFDEGTTDIVARNNLVYRTKTGGLHQHYGKNNLVTNNLFAFSDEGQLIRTRPEDHLSFTLEHNIVYYNQGTLLGSNWSGDTHNFKLDSNVYWNASGQPVTFAGKPLADWQKQGEDMHSIVADPQFVNSAAGDFHLKPGSPATQIGFVPFDVSLVGPQPDKTTPISAQVAVLAHEAVQQAEKPIPAAQRAFPPPPGTTSH